MKHSPCALGPHSLRGKRDAEQVRESLHIIQSKHGNLTVRVV